MFLLLHSLPPQTKTVFLSRFHSQSLRAELIEYLVKVPLNSVISSGLIVIKFFLMMNEIVEFLSFSLLRGWIQISGLEETKSSNPFCRLEEQPEEVYDASSGRVLWVDVDVIIFSQFHFIDCMTNTGSHNLCVFTQYLKFNFETFSPKKKKDSSRIALEVCRFWASECWTRRSSFPLLIAFFGIFTHSFP